MDIINNELLNGLTDLAKEFDRLRMNHNFHTSPDAPSQRMLNALETGKSVVSSEKNV